ncbi:hypothetical protein ACWGST_16975 [Agromyces sp. NPDC055520]
MTLTRILPTLRRSIPDPLAADRWPAATVASTTDVTVDGVSLLRLVELCGTPAVHLGPAAEPGTGGRLPSATMHTGVVVVRVIEASTHLERHGRALLIDADLAELAPIWAETRLIGRASAARAVPTRLTAATQRRAETQIPAATQRPAPYHPTSTTGCFAPPPIVLPGDLAAGDLLAVPYSAVTDDAGIARPTSGWPTIASPASGWTADYRSAGTTSAAKSSSPERS